MSALDKAIEAAGGLTRLADALKVSPQRVSNWRARGIPAEWVIAIETATGGAVKRHQLRPDLYPLERAV